MLPVDSSPRRDSVLTASFYRSPERYSLLCRARGCGAPGHRGVRRRPVDAVRAPIVANGMARARAGGRLRQGIVRIPARAAGAEKALGAPKKTNSTASRWKIDYAGRKRIIRTASSGKQITAGRRRRHRACHRSLRPRTLPPSPRCARLHRTRRRRLAGRRHLARRDDADVFKTVLFPHAASVRDRASMSRIRVAAGVSMVATWAAAVPHLMLHHGATPAFSGGSGNADI